MAKDIGSYCYDTLGAGITLKDYETGEEFKNLGTYEKFDQLELAKSLSVEVPELE